MEGREREEGGGGGVKKGGRKEGREGGRRERGGGDCVWRRDECVSERVYADIDKCVRERK